MSHLRNITSAVRLNAELKALAVDQARKESRTLSSLINFALKKYLEDQSEDARKYFEAQELIIKRYIADQEVA